MAMSLYQPPVGSTGWGAVVNLNFATLEDFCNNVANALLNAVPVMVPPSPGDGVKGLVPAPGSGDSPNFLAGDGEWREAGGPWGVVPVMVGDSGSGGVAGLVPAPGVGDAANFLKGNGLWASPAAAVNLLGFVSVNLGLGGHQTGAAPAGASNGLACYVTPAAGQVLPIWLTVSPGPSPTYDVGNGDAGDTTSTVIVLFW